MNRAKLIDYFERVYIINLPARKDRRRRILWQLKMAGVSVESGKVSVFPAMRPESANGFPGIGAHGCFLSHLAILRLAKKEGLKNLLIMEDDLILSPRIVKDEDRILETLRTTSWGMVFFGNIIYPFEMMPSSLHPYGEALQTSHFYGVNSTVFDRLTHYLEEVLKRAPGDPLGGPMHVDGAISMFRKQNPDILTLIASPNLGKQGSSKSDIADEKWFDRFFFLGWAGNVLQKIKTCAEIYFLWR